MSVEKLDFTDLANLSIIINNFRTLIDPALEEYKLIIDTVRGMNGQGKIKDNLVSYFDEIHGFILDSLNLGLLSYSSISDLYALAYDNYDPGKKLQFTQEGLSNVVTKMENLKTISSDYASQMSSHYNNISDLITVSFPSIDAVTDSLTTMQNKINTFKSDCEGFSVQYQSQIDSVKSHFDHLINFINEAQKITVSTYNTGDIGRLPSFKDLYNNCSNLINFLNDNQEQISEAASHIQAYVEMLQAQEEAKRLDNSFWSLIIEGVGIVVVGIATVISAGAVLIAVGAIVSTTVFAASRLCKIANVWSDSAEQKSTVHLRSMNDFSTALNGLRDNCFGGDQEKYNKYKSKVNALDKLSKEAVNAFALVNSLSGATSMIRSFEKQIVPMTKAAFKINTKATFKSQLRASKNVVVDMAKKQYQSGMFDYDGIYLLEKEIIPRDKDLVKDACGKALQDVGAERDINTLMGKEEMYRRQGYTIEQIAQKVALDESRAELTKAIGSVPSISRDIKKINKYRQGNIRARDLVTRSYDYGSKRINEVKTFLNGKIEDGSMKITENYGKYVS